MKLNLTSSISFFWLNVTLKELWPVVWKTSWLFVLQGVPGVYKFMFSHLFFADKQQQQKILAIVWMRSQILTIVWNSLGFSCHLSFQCYSFCFFFLFAITAKMTESVHCRVDPVTPRVIPLALCLEDVCYLSASVPSMLVNIFEKGKPFPMLGASCSSVSLLSWYGILSSCPSRLTLIL